MSVLTSNLLKNFPFSHYADAKTIQRGRDYFKEGRVGNIDLWGNKKAICSVDGDSGEYIVEIGIDKKTDDVYFDCDCPYAENHFCKHMVAVAMELSEFLNEDGVVEEVESVAPPSPSSAGKWTNKLDNILLQLPQSASLNATTQRYAAMLLMIKEDYYLQSTYSFTPYIVKARDWNVLQRLEHADRETINDLLDKNHEWFSYIEDMHMQTNPAGCLNLPLEAFNLLRILQQYKRFYSGITTYITYFPLLAQFQIPIFLVNRIKKSIQSRVKIFSQPVDIGIDFSIVKNKLNLTPVLNDELLSAGSPKAETLSYNPPWLMMDNKIFQLHSASHIPTLSNLPVSIPEKDVDQFREEYFTSLAESLPVRGDLIHWLDVETAPVPRLYLRDDKDKQLRAELRFSYDGNELAASKSGTDISIKPVPDSWDLQRIHRQNEKEQSFYQMLVDPIYRLKRADANQPYGTFELRARAHPFDFLLYSVPLLTQAGFEIFGEEKLKHSKINRATPTLRISIASGIDWFDLKTVVAFGDQQVSLHDVRKAIKRGEHYVKLTDGSIGQIPEEWLDKYKHLWGLAEETAEGLRIRDFHMPLIDSLLEDNADIQIPPDLAQRREKLRNFEKITPQPLPKCFNGELRPYQKHGFDWLHFLREYKFGGILADDMGLGKTIQVLVYLQSLKEQNASQNATLLVVPKSLIANWQREAEKFTPELRFLEYTGYSRQKDTGLFDAYDVVLTTYGTMLHDIDILHKYKFHYIVLDESQAIKNPLAKSAKAARLLNTEYRLVLTGTPVENNTFELWSQFAFLNPGLLGNMDYFKHEFATPIETGQDENTAVTLRKLVYPFILRRTKDQVAPELPPRTERIVYIDMDAAQKKLYAFTRERYRSELLGLIENEGVDNARFKILEGLLRLRQIAIHPALVDKNHTGESPKFDVLLETLETLQGEKHKALIFSQFVETLHLVRVELEKRQIKYVYLDGKTPDRQARVDLFQNEPSIPFFLISLKAGGVGLNLTAADYVFHLDPWWNPAVEMQASDRAHRIGQEKPVFVYKIIARNTVEEKILLLQEKKRALVKNLITTEGSFFKSLNQDDVKMLFA